MCIEDKSSFCSERRWISDDTLPTCFASPGCVANEDTSSVKNQVKAAAATDTTEHSVMTRALPSHDASGRKTDEPISAPTVGVQRSEMDHE